MNEKKWQTLSLQHLKVFTLELLANGRLQECIATLLEQH